MTTSLVSSQISSPRVDVDVSATTGKEYGRRGPAAAAEQERQTCSYRRGDRAGRVGFQISTVTYRPGRR